MTFQASPTGALASNSRIYIVGIYFISKPVVVAYPPSAATDTTTSTATTPPVSPLLLRLLTASTNPSVRNGTSKTIYHDTLTVLFYIALPQSFLKPILPSPYFYPWSIIAIIIMSSRWCSWSWSSSASTTLKKNIIDRVFTFPASSYYCYYGYDATMTSYCSYRSC